MKSFSRALWTRALALALPLASASGSNADNNYVPPHATVQPVNLEDIQWTEGFWADRFATVREQSIPAMWEIMRGTKYKPFLQHFLIAAGEAEGEYHGAPWNDGDFYKFLEAVTAVNAVSPDPKLQDILDRSIRAIGRAQREDGYIHTPVLIRQRNGDRDAQPFQDRHNFEMYNMGHLITAACLHRRVTGRGDFLGIARKTADFLDETFRNPTADLARNSVCPSHYMAMVEIYRTTREPRYLALAQKFLDMRNIKIADGGDDNQDRIPFLDQREAVGHAVRANYLYAGAADLLLESGDERLRVPLDAIWKNVTEQKMYITGGCGALYDGASPDGSENQSQITRVHQSYGRNYQLPSTTAHNETCAAVGSILWNWRMYQASGEAKYIDVLERALYNAVLSGISLDGVNYFYTNPLRRVDPLPTPLRWSRTRVPFITSYCCPPNVLRTIAEASGYVYGKTNDTIWVNLYGSNRLETELVGAGLVLTQRTNYPWDGRIEIVVDQCPTNMFAVKLRIPGWAASANVLVNRRAENVEITPATYAEIRRHWRPGDIVELQLPMPPQLIEANPLVEETRNQVAVERGPIVYCLESTDLPQGARVWDIVVPVDAKLVATFDPNLLGGVEIVEANAFVRPTGDWSDTLYRPVRRANERPTQLRLIPYYAWANRGTSEMSVWLNEK